MCVHICVPTDRHVCMHVNLYMCICAHASQQFLIASWQLHAHVHNHVCVCAYVCLYMCECVHLWCLCVYVSYICECTYVSYECIYVYVYMYMYVYLLYSISWLFILLCLTIIQFVDAEQQVEMFILNWQKRTFVLQSEHICIVVHICIYYIFETSRFLRLADYKPG